MSGISEEIIYPSVDDPEFSNKLQSHPLFNQYKYAKYDCLSFIHIQIKIINAKK